MPATPETWREEFLVNAGNTTGSQFEPQITQLANGNILVAWTDTVNNVDSQNGRDIIGQIFDPLGNAVGLPIHLNDGFYFADDENQFEVAALPDGGFVMVFEDEDADGVSIRSVEFDADGVETATRTILADPGAIGLNDPSVAVAANGDYLVTFQREDGGDVDTYMSLVDVSTGIQSPPVIALASSNLSVDRDIQANSTAALSNGNFVVVTRRDGADSDIVARVINSTGTPIGAFFTVGGTSADGEEDFGADVAALTGGGFVVAWSNTDTDTDIFFQRYSNAGVAQGGATLVGAAAPNNSNNELSMAALTDGGFVIVWDDDQTNTITGQRFSATGGEVGAIFTIADAGVETGPEVIGLADGRFAVTWEADGDIRSKIFDPRDDANGSAVYTSEGWQIGTVGGDFITADFAGDIVHGWDGDDTLAAGLGADTLIGGDGSDFVSYASSTAAVIVNLDSGFGYGGYAAGDMFDGIEGALGSDFNDQIYGDAGANFLKGGGGSDSLIGGLGDDALAGGSGSDLANYAASNAAVIVNLATGLGYGGHAAGDTYGSVENATGSIFNDQLYGDDGANILNGFGGNDSLIGGLGGDTLIGGDGSDLANYAASNAAVIVNLASGLGYGGHAAGDSYSTVENATGSIFNDQLYGNGGANILNGFDGADSLIGGLGADTLIGGDGLDLINYSASNAGVVVNLSSGLGIFGHAAGDTFSGVENVTGSGFRDVIIGNAADNILRGGGGHDTFHFGPGGGFDTIMDFADDLDDLDFSGFGFASAAQALGFASDTGSSVLFDFGGGDSLLLAGVANVSDLSNDIIV